MRPILTYLTSKPAIAIYALVVLIGAGFVTGAVSVDTSDGSYTPTVSTPQLPAFFQDTEPGEHKFWMSGLNKTEWRGGMLRVHFNEDHGTDYFVIEHSSREPDPWSNPPVGKAAPRYDGVIEIPLRDIVEGGAPTGEYKIATFKGDINMLEGEVNTQIENTETITIRPELKVEDAEFNEEGVLEMELRNVGNAPAYLKRIDNIGDGASADVGRIIPLRDNTTVSVMPFTVETEGRGRCRVFSSNIRIRLVTEPDLEKITELDTGLEDGERYCERTTPG